MSSNPQFDFAKSFGRKSGGRRVSPLSVTVGILVAVGIALVSLSGFYADWLWYKSVNYTNVWSTTLFTKIYLFIGFGLITSLFVLLNVYLAYRRRPVSVSMLAENDNLERYRAQLEPLRKVAFAGVGLAVFYFAGTAGTSLWRSWLLFKNSTEFGVKDVQFNLDISFFAFRLPFWQSLISWGFSALILAILASGAVHYLYGGLRPQVRQDRSTPFARAQLSVLLGLVVLLKGVAYWFDRYALSLKENKLITGLTYSDVNALLPAKAILAGIAVICSLLFFANIFRKSWFLPASGTALLVISSVLIAGVYPAAIQTFQVKPSESSKEAPYIQRNIDATRDAYDLSGVEMKDYAATLKTTSGQLANDAATIANIRLMDPNVISATFRQLQQIKPYYAFPDSLDVDRYTINGVQRDTVVAVRELNIDGNPSRNWINDHLVYTHGFGFVAAFGNTVDLDGKPNFAVGDLPPTKGLGEFQPRVYFGENVPDYSIIGGVKTDSPVEFDFPDDSAANGQKNYTYTGTGGVPVGSFFNKLVFAIKYQEQKILLSSLINKDSKILFERNPRERVAKAAPWLTLDGDPYPAVVDGKVLWIIDGYTTSAGYPYARKTSLSGSTTDALTANSNSITAQADTPEDMFRIQRDILSAYHVKSAAAFYGGQDFWRVPRDPSTFGANAGNQPPYYMTLQMPGATKSTFSLTTPFVPRGGRENLSAFAAVNSEAGPDYGKITVLQLPRSTNIAGPSQVASNFEAKPEVANSLSLLRQGGSDVVLGNLVTLPVGSGLLYVQPVYVRATSNTAAYPLLQKVLVSFGDQIGFDDTLKGALDQVFGGNSGTTSASNPSTSSTTNTSPKNSTALSNALRAAAQAMKDYQAANAKGDLLLLDVR